ncbi:MAG: hypothetical protein JWM31_2963, partial [Solirubrobacterales bacterium]|nr:hypothetical protein [Solirubrobacterales bacterium]
LPGRVRPGVILGHHHRMTDMDKTHTGAPHDSAAREPLGPFTPDAETDLGDTPEVHDEITVHDLPRDHPGRATLVREAGLTGTGRGNR